MDQTFHALHSLRGLAALAVLLFHADAVLGMQLAPSGYLAVDLFFILSGFVIAHAYDPRFEAGLGVKAFIIARAVRFWPLFALGTAIGAAWLLLENIVAPPAALSVGETFTIVGLSLLYVPQITTGDLFPLDVPAWSLFFELLVNAGFAIVFAASKTRWLPATIAGSGAVVAYLAASGLFEVQAWGMFRAVFGFALGVFLYRRKWTPPRVPSALIIAAVCATFALPQSAALEIGCVFVAYPLAITLLATANGKPPSRVLETLGMLSFPLYALHYPILQAALGLRDHLPIPAVLTGLAALAACVAAAWLGELFVDRPMRRVVRRRVAYG